MAHCDLEEIKKALLEREITWEKALEQLATRGKPWHTEAWNERRQALIQERCEQCGSAEPPMVLQHLRQPRSFRELCQEVRRPLYERYQAEHLFTRTEHQPVDRPACPRCYSTAIRPQKRGTHAWRCYGKQRGRTCGNAFDAPSTVQALTPDQKHARSAEWQAQYCAAREDFDQRFRDEIGTQAVLLSIEEHTRYMSCVDTVTFCKKCAFLWDQRKLKLCVRCRQRYHGFHRPCCSDCETVADGDLE